MNNCCVLFVRDKLINTSLHHTLHMIAYQWKKLFKEYTRARRLYSEVWLQNSKNFQLFGPRVARSPVFYGRSRISDPFSHLPGEAAGKNKSPVFC